MRQCLLKEKHTENIQKNKIKIKLTETEEYMGVGRKENYNLYEQRKKMEEKYQRADTVENTIRDIVDANYEEQLK